MNFVVSLDSDVNFAPETEVVEILQNVRTILATRKGRCLWTEILDCPGSTWMLRRLWLRCK